MHRATKRVEGGPRPNHDLGDSMQRIKQRTDQNTTLKARRAAFDATAKQAKKMTEENMTRVLPTFVINIYSCLLRGLPQMRFTG